VARGFLYEPKPRGGFYPTPRWLSLAREIAAAEPLPEAVVNLIADLGARSGETICFTAPSGQYAVFIEALESQEAIRYSAKVGNRLPLHATASGLAILSQFAPAQRTAVLRKAVFERYGDGTPMNIDAVEEEIRTSLARGWFNSASAFSEGLGGVAVPLVLDERIFALTIAGPLFRIGQRTEEFAEMLHEAVARHLGKDYFAENVPDMISPPRLTGSR